MTKTEKVVAAIAKGGLDAGEAEAQCLGLGFYRSQFKGAYELWVMKDGAWVRQLHTGCVGS